MFLLTKKIMRRRAKLPPLPHAEPQWWYVNSPMIQTEFRVPSDSFGLGRILDIPPGGRIDLELSVPSGDRLAPFFWLRDADPESFKTLVSSHPAISEIEAIASNDGDILYTLSIQGDRDFLFTGIAEHAGQVLHGHGTPTEWEFGVRFPSHTEVSEFQTYCEHAKINLTLDSLREVSHPDSGSELGLTREQTDALTLAVEKGYYDIPRRSDLCEIGDEMGISSAAASERLRRGVKSLVTNGLLSRTPSARTNEQVQGH